jgi:citrate lyase gamma subunit
MLLLSVSCGYNLIGKGNYLPEDIKTIRVDMVQNVSYKYGIESQVTNALIDRLSSYSGIDVVNKGKADAVLKGRIKNYVLKPIEIDQGGYVTKYQISISLSMNLLRLATNEDIWRDDDLYFYKNLDVSQSIVDSLEFESRALEDISEEIADRVITTILMNF